MLSTENIVVTTFYVMFAVISLLFNILFNMFMYIVYRVRMFCNKKTTKDEQWPPGSVTMEKP